MPGQPRRGNRSNQFCEPLEQRRMLHAVANVTSVLPLNGTQKVATSSNITVAFDEALDPASVTADRITLLDPSGTPVAASLKYTAGQLQVVLDPTPTLTASAGYYTVKIAGGANGVKTIDGATLSKDVLSYFTCGTPNIGMQTVFSGLTQPTNVEFSPDGRIYVAEKSGIVKLFDNLTDTTATVAADLRTNVHNFWDRGLLGMALDPQFTTGRPYIYVLYTYDATIGGVAPKWGTAGATADGGGTNASTNGATASCRLSRFAVNASGVMTGSEQVLINDWDQQFPSHSIGDVKFGPDGYLYISAGDGASFNVVDSGGLGTNPFPDPAKEGGALRSQDILSDGDPATLDGSVIRVDPNTGAAAPGNPYASSADANKRRIIANGLRNPFRITFKPGTSELYIAETGWNSWEEINRIPNATDAVAENFGWPAYEGNNAQSGYQSANLPLLSTLYANPNLVTKPFYTYSHSEAVVAGSGEPTGGSTPTGLAFYTGASYPLAFQGALFFCDYARQRLYVMYAGPDGQVNPANRQLIATGDSVELTTGPNGDVFAVNHTSGTITRLVATGYSRPPVASITTDRTTGTLPLTVKFDGSASVDPDGGQLTYAWDLDGDGNFNDSTAAKPAFTYTLPADTTVRLKVTDLAGLSAIASVVIRPANTAPVPTITLPSTSLTYAVGDTINFAGSATDAEDGTLAASQLTWSLAVVHANDIDPTNIHEHSVTSFAGISSGSFVAPDHEAPSWLVLRLTATDSRGLATTTSLRINPKTVTLSFTSTPTGLKITFNGTEYTGAFTKTVNVNSANSLSVTPSQTLNGTNYNFANWSQGGAAAQIFNAPASATTYTAVYTPAAPPASGYVKLTGTVIGTTSLLIPAATDRSKPYDGSLATYFDTTVSGAWTGLDLGTARTITQIKFAPRDTYGSRMTGGVFQASNTADFSSGVVELYKIPAAPTSGVLTTAAVTVATAYRYVRYLGPTGGNGNVSEIEFYTTAAAAVPAMPGALAGTVLTNKQVKLTWTDASSDETGFVIQRRYQGWIWEDLPIAVGANTTTVTDTTSIGGVTYEYRIAAKNAAGTSLWLTAILVDTAVTGAAPPAAPSGLTAAAVSGTLVNLAWTDNSTTEIGFRVERRLLGGTFALLATLGANAKAYADPTVTAGNTYEYRVVATDGTNDSAYSNTASATTPTAGGTLPAAPTGLTATRGTGSLVNLSWLDNSNNETAFRIERRYRGWVWDTSFTVGAGVTSFTDTTGFLTCTYEYRVIALNGTGDSAASNLVEVVL